MRKLTLAQARTKSPKILKKLDKRIEELFKGEATYVKAALKQTILKATTYTPAKGVKLTIKKGSIRRMEQLSKASFNDIIDAIYNSGRASLGRGKYNTVVKRSFRESSQMVSGQKQLSAQIKREFIA